MRPKGGSGHTSNQRGLLSIKRRSFLGGPTITCLHLPPLSARASASIMDFSWEMFLNVSFPSTFWTPLLNRRLTSFCLYSFPNLRTFLLLYGQTNQVFTRIIVHNPHLLKSYASGTLGKTMYCLGGEYFFLRSKNFIF